MNILNLLKSNEIKKTKMVEYKENSTIFFEDEKCDSIGIILQGKIEISSYLSSGEKVVYNTLSDGEMFGANLIFSSHPFYKGNVTSLTKSYIRIIEKDALMQILLSNKKFLSNYLKIQSDFTKKLNSKIKLLSMNTAKERIIFALESNENNTIHFKTISDLASDLGLTREATSRGIAELVKNNLIVYNKKSISLK